jgi:hypothetical protein
MAVVAGEVRAFRALRVRADTGQEAYGRGKEDSRVGRRYAGGRLDRRGAMLMSVSAASRFWFAGVDREWAGRLR